MEKGINSWIDFVVIGVYFVFVITVGLLSMCRKNRESVQGYFLAGRTMHWLPIGASLFASNIGSEHFVGLAGSGAASGIAVVAFEWGAVMLLLLLGWFFLPIYLSAQVYTIPEYLGRRFGGYRMRVYQSCVAIALYVLTKVSVDVYAGGVFIQQATGWNLYVSMVPLLLLTALYTILGGLAAVVFTDALQTVIMLTGAIVLAVMAYVKVGGLEALYAKYPEAVPDVTFNTTTLTFNTSVALTSNSTCGLPRDDAFHIFRDPVTSDLPWPGVIVRATLASLWYWCADQVIVQRALAARSMAHAQGACLMAGVLKLSPLFLIVLPGMAARVLYPDEVACADEATCMEVCNNPAGCSNVAYPLLILKMAPTGLRGLLMAVMVAALMSSLTSIFNSAATVFSMDLWRRAKPQASERQLLLVGRLFVVALVIVSVAWIPLIVGSAHGQLFIYIQAVTGYVAPPICAIFLLAIFVPRVNERGAFWGVLSGQATGLTRLVLDQVYPAPGCGEPDPRPAAVRDVNFTYFSIVVLAVTTVVAVLVSLTAPRQTNEELDGLTWWSLRKRLARDAETAAGKRPSKSHQSSDNVRTPEENPHSHGSYVAYVTYDEKPNFVTELKIKNSHKQRDGIILNDAILSDEGEEGGGYSVVIAAPWRHVLNAGAVVLLSVLAFLFVFFA